MLKLKNSNLTSKSFSTPFLISQKCPTMSPHQEAIASSTSSLIWGFKEFTTMVEPPTRPWSSLSCFEATPSMASAFAMPLWPVYSICHYGKCIRYAIIDSVFAMPLWTVYSLCHYGQCIRYAIMASVFAMPLWPVCLLCHYSKCIRYAIIASVVTMPLWPVYPCTRHGKVQWQPCTRHGQVQWLWCAMTFCQVYSLWHFVKCIRYDILSSAFAMTF